MIRFSLLITFILIINFQGVSQIITQKTELEPTRSSINNDKHRCGTPDPDEHTHQYILDNIIANEQEFAGQRNDVTNCLPMKIHIITEDDGSGGLVYDSTVYVRVPLFDPLIENEYWEYDNDGLKHLQVRIYPWETDVSEGDGDLPALPQVPVPD